MNEWSEMNVALAIAGDQPRSTTSWPEAIVAVVMMLVMAFIVWTVLRGGK